jgi:hypothetical protein
MYVYQGLIVLVLLISAIFLAISLLGLTFIQVSGANNNLTPYQNPTYGIKLQYPSNWTRIEPNQTSAQEFEGRQINEGITGIVVLKPPLTGNINSSSFASMSIQTYNGSKFKTLEELISHQLNLLNLPALHFHIISKNTTNLAGAPAKEFISTYQTPFSNHKEIKIYEGNVPRIYMLTYDADNREFDYYLPTIQKIIDSIEITK